MEFDFDRTLRAGLQNLWYPICQSTAVAGAPYGMTRLGADIVAWRDTSGRVHVHRDSCLHRGTRLSDGVVGNDQIRCAYHGWSYDGEGRCVHIPTSRNANETLAPKLRLQTYPSQERAGLVWTYFSEQGVATPDLVLPDELEDPEWSGFICEIVWDVNWILILENLADPMHGPFLHSNSFTLSRGTLEDDMRIIRNDDGFTVERSGQRGVNFDWAEFYWAGTLWVRLDIPLPWGPRGTLRIVGMVTPIDGNRSLVYFLRYRQLSGAMKMYWRLMYRYFWEAQHAKVIDQDRVILESQRGARSRSTEHLANSDRGVHEFRRFLREHARGTETRPNLTSVTEGGA